MTDRQRIWKTIIEYKFYFGEFRFLSNFTDFVRFGKYLNENVFCKFDENSDLSLHLTTIYDNNQDFLRLCEIFTEKNLSAREYYPQDLIDIEKYYFGAENNILTYKEAFFADYVASYFYSAINIESFITKLEADMERIEEKINYPIASYGV